ncbi:GNAT family N-acetyltransferase [Microbacterium sp. EYE_5]|uniref:GNAT family N-acetyltransferase n=1 Tax=unclassified Microbacterium TaxID=2609290 RepID=UPI002005D4DB|nr:MULTISPECIES: GNAT family N-acetyltransferase [unclassified Microbacterium]MCK6079736.1 GNAT family N-acetyltransferase [Microbacterium sp. EYE_382]MCK6085007.1 GNAT family N-acetyltransferase [Microbacterium sp. EYE_384]MCK6122767.1 GNAT family N-acetyltransferase [Microbacterium sp. EYE_80]MCK6125770.1 GNAT family N-acetyltransferase [Microbacterium sp. EYE_79]MCK6140691.1 GNAT family N-acetyltransferase [Microbacterium sp. EYE_39]
MITIERWDSSGRSLLAQLNTPEMTAHLGGPETEAQLDDRQERYLRTWDDRPGAMYRIDVDGRAAGGIGYWPVDEGGVPAFETGWSVLPEFQGRGVATAALRLVIAEVRRDGSRELLMAYPGVDNAPSNALCARAGFEERGVGSEPWRGGVLTFRRWALDMSPLDLTGCVADIDERFDGQGLDPSRWWPYYTPHWSSRERTAARYAISAGLELRIDADTEPWAPEWDGDVRVSHLQTGQRSGAVGSGVGQHRFRGDLVVREEQEERRLWLPHFGVIEARMSAVRHPDAMVAFWPIGFESEPEESGEICIAEIFGSEIDDEGGLVGVGVKPQNDPRLREDFEKVRVDGDLTVPHDYAVEWTPERLRFFVDGRWVKTVPQTIDYPVQLMLDLYELPSPGGARDVDALPHAMRVERVRTFRR